MNASSNIIKSNGILDSFIFVLLYFILIIDSLNGYFINIGTHLPIAQSYKFILTFLIFIRVMTFMRLRFLPISIILYLTLFLIYITLKDSGVLFWETLIHLSKIIFVILSFYYFKNLLLIDSQLYFKKMLLILNINFLVLCLNLLSKYFGLGFATYGESDVGTMGFFNAANELSGIILIFNSFYVYYVTTYFNKKKIKKLLFFIFLLYLSLLVSTKTAIIGTLLILLFIPFVINPHKIFRVSILKYIISFVPFILLVVYVVQVSGIYERWIFYFDKGGFDLFFTSGRLDYVQNEILEYLNSNILVLLLGLGGNRTVESDFFDVILNYGVLGVILIYSFYLSIFVSANKNRKKGIYPFASLVMFVGVLFSLVSFFAGHIIFSAMAGVFLSLVNSLAFYKDSKTIFI